MSEGRKGFGFGVSAYLIWGAFPLYFPLLEPARAVEILAHRVLWSCVVMGALVLLLRRTGHLRAILADRRTALFLLLAAVVISLNWGLYIWAVTNERVVEASLGYYINPLVTVLIGVLVLGERLRRAQWLAIVLAAAAVVFLAVQYGQVPWVSLALASCFGTYGLAKKKADTGAVESLAFETILLAPLAVGYLVWLGDAADFGRHGIGHALMLSTTGIVTAVPLICFGAAAIRVSMVTIGLLQYLTPTLQFALGVFWFGEPMPPARWIGFAMIWLALVVFTVESVNHRRRQLRLAAEAAAL